MEEGQFTLDIVTLKKVAFSEGIKSVNAPGAEGYFSILVNHTPFVSSLKAGIIKVTRENEETSTFSMSGGFLMTDGKKVMTIPHSKGSIFPSGLPAFILCQLA